MDTAKVQMMPLSNIFTLHDDENVSRSGSLFRDNNDLATLASQFCTDAGYNLSIGGPIIVFKAEKAERDQGLLELTQRLNALKSDRSDLNVKVLGASYKVSPNDHLVSFQNVYMKADKVQIGNHIVNVGNRRITAMITINAVREKAGLPPILEVPVVVKTYESKADQYADCVQSNTRMTAGARKLSNADLMHAARRMFHEQCNEKRFRETFKDGTGQKLFAICRLDHEIPQIGLVDGIITDAIKFGAISKENARKFLKRINDGETDPESLTVESVVKDISGAGGNKTKIASRSDIEAASQTPIVPFQLVIKAILANDMGRLNKFIDHADAINAKWVETSTN